MGRHHMFVQAFYIIGFEHDTVPSVRSDVEALARLDVDLVQVQVLTPYPQTRERDNIAERFGLHDHDYSHYNSRHLVWNHPRISRAEMRELQRFANARLASSSRALRTLAKFAVFGGRRQLGREGMSLLAATLGRSSTELHRNYQRGLNSARAWSRVGWYSYEGTTPTAPGSSSRSSGGRSK
jgi:hypothetical protein